MEEIINSYYSNGAKKLRGIVDKITRKYGGISDKDMDDFYSLANEVFTLSLRDFDNTKCNFDGFLYSNLSRRIITEIRDRNRGKRSSTKTIKDEDGNIIYEFIYDMSMDAPGHYRGGGSRGENFTFGELIPDKFDLEQEVIEEKREVYSDKMMKYLDRLSDLQKHVLRLIIAGYPSSEIVDELHITQKQYSDCNVAIHSYSNVSVLF